MSQDDFAINRAQTPPPVEGRLRYHSTKRVQQPDSLKLNTKNYNVNLQDQYIPLRVKMIYSVLTKFTDYCNKARYIYDYSLYQ